MQISRQSYVEFFLLYTDGELGADEKRAVEEFVKENPDLEEELVMMQQTVLRPDESIVFEDKEQLYRKEERKVIPWFRLAAAAVLVIAFSIFGWLYVENKQMVRDEQVASSDLQPAQQEPVEKNEPGVVTGEEPVHPRSLRDHPRQRGTGDEPSVVRNQQPASNTNPPLAKDAQSASGTYPPLAGVARSAGGGPTNNNQPSVTETDQPSAIDQPPVPEHTLFEQDVAIAEPPVEDVEIRVSPRHIDVESEPATAKAQTANIRYVEAEEPEMIYFANTTIPKNSKLRGVIRKASRILDKVTSFQ